MDEHLSNLDLVEMGRRFAAIRKHLGLSQTDVANEIGTFQITISKIESGSNSGLPRSEWTWRPSRRESNSC